MKTQSPDTSPEIEKVQFELLRRAGAQKRLQLARAHTRATIRLSRRRIAREHPAWSEQEVALHWAALTYGEELAGRARRELERRGRLL
jgi:hypothetical protein